ncbi:PE-PPE domain-containing protein [Mycolicibacterium austroafricanum]|uniref:PE-PPE domain-containing protein n=1 Tax=Mycolicibacterium austroafricanum TaxID=39687 RepID=UPI001CA34BBE|nr:PE-PPE domain-containing protein [Mycolicibacterium austroafricanum]QZT64972.1 PE-PPE domain-containing protein [Mycolicibacterium austroafricanum]
MPAGVRSYVTAGVALVGASVISATPVVPNLAAAQQEVRSVSMDVNLTAQSVANVPANLVNMFLNMPQAHVNAVNYWADSWVQSGNWWVYSQDNILGWDRANPAMAWSMTDLLLPIPALSKPYGRHVQWWMAANLPMHAGCSGLPPCPNSADMFNSMFRVGAWEFYFGDGYTFGEDGYTPEFEPVGPGESYWGYEYGEDGDPVPWYGQTVKLDPLEGWKSLISYLMETPEEVEIPTFADSLAAYMKFMATLVTMYNPFVPQSYLWNPRYSASAYLLRPFAKYLCPQCNPYDPFMPVDWEPGDPYPTPVDDGWYYGSPPSGTPTGLPLPTEPVPPVPGNGETALMVGGTWPTNVLTQEQMKTLLGGYFADYSRRVNMVYPGSLQDPFFSVAIGAGILMNQITATPGPKTVYGFSQGALVANLVMGLLENKATSPDKEDLKFILVADPSRGPNNAYQYVLVPETKYDITVLSKEYDGVADFPDRWWNALAVANALAGISTVHLELPDTDLDAIPDEYKSTTCNSKGGCTTKIFLPTDELPLVTLLPFLKPYEDQLKAWIDEGYSRNDVSEESLVNSLLESLAPDTDEKADDSVSDDKPVTTEEGQAEDGDDSTDLSDVIENVSGNTGSQEAEESAEGGTDETPVTELPGAGEESEPIEDGNDSQEVDPVDGSEEVEEVETPAAPEEESEADSESVQEQDSAKRLTVREIQDRLANEATGATAENSESTDTNTDKSDDKGGDSGSGES